MRHRGVRGEGRCGLLLVGLNAAPTGSGNRILRFNAAPTVIGVNYTLAQIATVVNDATVGTTITMLKPGRWHVSLYLRVLTAVQVIAGLSMGAVGAELTGDPEWTLLGTRGLGSGRTVQAAAGDVVMPELVGEAQVSQELINSGGAVIRGHVSDGAGASPAAAALQLAQCAMLITYAGDLPGA